MIYLSQNAPGLISGHIHKNIPGEACPQTSLGRLGRPHGQPFHPKASYAPADGEVYVHVMLCDNIS